MHKIYSRPRINLPKIIVGGNINKNPEKSKRMTTLIIILIIAFSTVKLILDAINPVFYTLCENKSLSIATNVSNEQSSIVIREHRYEDMFTIEKDTNGNVAMIKSNIIAINEITSDIASRIQQEIDKKGNDNISIPLGSLSGLNILAGAGPGIDITIKTVGNVLTDLKSEFVDAGINQTLHKIYLQVTFEVSIVTPFQSIAKEITNQVLLMENVIVGTIPNTYYNFNGLNENRDILETID